MENTLTPENMQLNEVALPGFCSPGKSLINEVKALRREVNAMRDALHPVGGIVVCTRLWLTARWKKGFVRGV